jgi:hypothetical protein
MTLQQKCVEILTDMLKRQPTPQEIGNVMTDANIVNRAIIELSNV